MIYRGNIYEPVLLEAYTFTDITRIYGSKLKEKIAKEKNRDISTVQDSEVGSLITEIEQADPSSDKKWLGSITSWLIGKRLEDLDAQIKPTLIQFNKLLQQNPGKFGAIAKNISKGKLDYDKFVDIVDNQESNTLDDDSKQIVADRIREKTSDFKMIAENVNYVMYYIDQWVDDPNRDPNDDEDVYTRGHARHICFTGRVKWCVRVQAHFNNYKPPYYYVLSKKDGHEYALMHLESRQLKNIKNNGMSIDELKPIVDLILPIVLKHIEQDEGYRLLGDMEVIREYIISDFNLVKKYGTMLYGVVELIGKVAVENQLALVDAFKNEFNEATKKNSTWIEHISEKYQLAVIQILKDGFNEAIKDDPVWIRLIPKKYQLAVIQILKDGFNEVTKNYPFWIHYIHADDRLDIVKMFKDSFNEGTKNLPSWIKQIPEINRLDIVKMFKDSFNEGTKKNPTWIEHIPERNRLDIIKMFRDSFSEGTKEDPAWIRLIPEEDQLAVVQILEEESSNTQNQQIQTESRIAYKGFIYEPLFRIRSMI